MATPSTPKVRVMVDANVLIASSVWARWTYQVLRHALDGDFQLVLSPFVVKEARRRVAATFPASRVRFEEQLGELGYEEVADASA